MLGALALGLGLAGYSILSYALMAHAPDRAWTVLALFGPLLAALALAAAQRRHWPTLAGCAALAALLVWAWRRGGIDVNRLYVLQHAAIHAVLAWGFAITLRPGGTALITQLGERVHGAAFTPAMRAYTRTLTGAWVLFFIGMIVVSLALYAAAPWPVWSFFCTVLTPAAVLAFFVIETAWRYRRHPEFDRVSITRAINAWRQHG